MMSPFYFTVLTAGIAVVLYFISPVLPPFLIGALIAWLCNPLVKWLMRHGLPRIFAVMLIFFLIISAIFTLLFWVVPLVIEQISHFVRFLPTAMAFLQQRLHALGNFSGIEIPSLKTTLAENWTKAGGVADWVVRTVLHSGMRLLVLFGNLLLIPVVAIYLLYDWEDVLQAMKRLLPERIAPVVIALVRECDAVLAAFFHGQLLVMLTLGCIYAVGLSLLGMQVGVLIGLVTGVLSIVPYLGVVIGLISASLVVLVQTGNWHDVLPILILFGVVQVLDGMFITPHLVGHRIGLHPVVVIFAVLTGGVVAGFTGVLLALPVAALIRVLATFFVDRMHKQDISYES